MLRSIAGLLEATDARRSGGGFRKTELFDLSALNCSLLDRGGRLGTSLIRKAIAPRRSTIAAYS